MDGEQFDALVRRALGDGSRRGLVRAGLGSLVASGLAVLGLRAAHDAEAQKKKKRRLQVEACIPTGKRCPSKKLRGHPRRRKARSLSCRHCCQKHVTTVAGVTTCACQPDSLPCKISSECCGGICSNGVCRRANPSPPPPSPLPRPPSFLDICGIGYEICANSSDGCCVAGQDCCPTPGIGINGCCGFDYTCLPPDGTYPEGRCTPICDDPAFPVSCTNDFGCCPAARPVCCSNLDLCCTTSFPVCCPNGDGCCAQTHPVCCAEFGFCCPAGTHCDPSGCLPGGSSVQTQAQSQRTASLPMFRDSPDRKGRHDKSRPN